MPRASYRASLSHKSYVSSLYGAALLRLAQAVGLHQAGLAAYLGVDRVQVNHWKHGRQSISTRLLPLVVKRVKEALEHTLARPGPPTKDELAALLNPIFHENLQALGFPCYPTLRALLTQLTAVSSQAGTAPDITPYQAELKTLAGALNLTTGIINDLAELLGMLDCPALTFLSGATEDHHADTHREESEVYHRT